MKAPYRLISTLLCIYRSQRAFISECTGKFRLIKCYLILRLIISSVSSPQVLLTRMYNWPVDDLAEWLRFLVSGDYDNSEHGVTALPVLATPSDTVVLTVHNYHCHYFPMCFMSVLLMVIYCSCNQILPCVLYLPGGTFCVN